MRPLAYKRHMDFVKAIRKRRISREIDNTNWAERHDWYNNLHQYSKNKIHCSCPLCSCKTNNRGRYGKAMNWNIHDQRQLDNMKYEEIHSLDIDQDERGKLNND